MAKKPAVTTLASGFNSTETLNANFEALRDGFDNTLSLDGSTPNAMGGDLDLNSNSILNATAIIVGGSDVVATTAAALAAANQAQVDADAAVVASALSETNAANSATASQTSANASQASRLAAELAETNAETAETNAETAETNAETAETNAAASAAAALASETAAAASEAGVDADRVAAQTAATNAATSETNAATSETNAATSETNAATSETNAATSATSASDSASAASSSAAHAGSSETAAATSETNAASSAFDAAVESAEATTQAGVATTKAAEAATSATNAATSETNAATSATSAQASKDAALAALDSFDDRYLGQKSADPTVDNDGDALVSGALYFNTTDDIMKVYDGSLWVAAYASLSGAMFGANNLSDVADAAGSRQNLGLGTGDSPTFAGLTTTANVSFGDNDKAIFGAGSDLQIYHDGSDNNSYIKENGAGSLYVDAANLIFRTDTGENLAKFLQNGQVQLFNDNALKLATTSTGVAITGNATFADNGKAIFGAGSDLQIYHNGTHSFIDDAGAGDLKIRATNLKLNSYSGDNYLTATVGAAVDLYYNNAPKLATTSTGVNVTGTITSDGLTVDGAVGLQDSLSQSRNVLYFDGSDNLVLATGTTAGVRGIDMYTNNNKSLSVAESGDISFYEDTGTTPKFFWDASAESLGIGTSSPAAKLHVQGTYGYFADGAYNGYFGKGNGVVVGGGAADLGISTSTGAILFGTGGSLAEAMRITSSGNVGIGTTTPQRGLHVNVGAADVAARFESTDELAQIEFYDNTSTNVNSIGAIGNDLLFKTNNGERLRIDSSGNVGIGTISPSLSSTYDRVLHVHSPSGSLVKLTDDTSGSGVNDGLDVLKYGPNAYIINRDSGGFLALSTSNSEVMRITSSGVGIGTSSPTGALDVNGDIHTSGNVGIGTDSPFGKLAVYGDTDAAVEQILSVVNEGTGVGTGARIWLSGANATSRGAYLEAAAKNSGNAHDLVFATNTSGAAPVEAMRIDSSGNLLVGTTDRNQVVNNGTTGIVLGNDGFIGASRTDSDVMVLDREDSDGGIISFRKDGSTVGSIAAGAGGFLTIGSPNGTPVYATFANGSLKPTTSLGSNSDGSGDLGNTSSRWKDLYLSGGVYLGGTGAANKLDDYEVGAASGLAISGSYGNCPSSGWTLVDSDYVKVGKSVTVRARFINTSTNNVQVDDRAVVSGLPFTADSLGTVASAGTCFIYGQISSGTNAMGVTALSTTGTDAFFYITHEDGSVQYNVPLTVIFSYKTT